MTWVKLDDRAPQHPKIVGLSDAAFACWVRALCWCSQHLTDGRVPAAARKVLGTARAAAELVSAGLWVPCDDGWDVVGYLDHQTPRSSVEREREGARERAARSRQKRADVRPRHAVTDPHVRECHGEVREPDTDTDTEPRSVGNSPRLGPDAVSDRPIGADQVIAAIAAKCGEPVLGAWAKQVQSAVLGRDPGRFVAAVEQAPDGLRLPGLVQLVEQVGRRTGQPMDAVSSAQRVPDWAPDVTPIAADAAERAREIAAGLRGER